MKFSFDKKTSYNAPEGEHIGWLKSITYDPERRMKNGCESEVRFTFYLQNEDRLNQYAVARNFCLDCGQRDELQHFLESWLGDDLEQFIDTDGKVDLDLLVDRPALIHVLHKQSRNGKHANPYCWVADIEPAPENFEQEAA